MDGSATPSLEARLIALDITDAAHRLWGELYEDLMRSGDEYGRGPSLERAWEMYVEQGAHNYAWWDSEGAFNAAGWTAFLAFTDAFEDGAGVYGWMHAG